VFFPERIQSIDKKDRVLEVGPGGTPHQRSNVFLEKRFTTEAEAEGQRGFADPLVSDKELLYYDGGRFPFKDNAFGYVICSHVLEHVATKDIPFFLSELSRVAQKGYIEFPTIYYDFIYNFPEHVSLLLYRNGKVNFIDKKVCGLGAFSAVQSLFYESLKAGYCGVVTELKEYFFQGFEWENNLFCQKAHNLEEMTFCTSEIKFCIQNSFVDKKTGFYRRMLRRLMCG